MNKLKYFLFGFIALTLVACAGDEELPYVEFDGLGYGAYPRLIDGINGEYGTAFNFFDVPGSSIEFTVEFFDENNGQNVDSYNWTVTYTDDSSADMGTVTSAAFGTSPTGLPTATIGWSFQEVLDALGKTIDDVDGGERFVFEGTLKKKDGATFTSSNTSGNIQSTAGTLRGMFQIVVPIICPSPLAGTYAAATVGWCGDPWDGMIKFVETDPGTYEIHALMPAREGADEDGYVIDFSMGAYNACYSPTSTLPGGNLLLGDACNKLGYSGASRWGETYFFNEVTVAGKDLILDWYNDYDPEAGVTTLTRDEGDWPPLVK